MPGNSACRQAESGSARIFSRRPKDLPRAPVTRPWKWWTMSGRWADRPLAPRCSTKSPLIPHGSRLLFSIWATLSCRPTPPHAVRLKLYSADGPDPRALLERAVSRGTSSIGAGTLPLDGLSFHNPVREGLPTNWTRFADRPIRRPSNGRCGRIALLAIAEGPGAVRRNVVTRGVPINHLVGREFQVGAVRLRGTRLCEPCAYLEGLTQKGVLAGLIHRGGLRAEIVTGGTILGE